MKKYFFGYLFVRLSKFLAILLVIAGCAVAIYFYARAVVAARAVRYVPSYELQQRQSELRSEWEKAQRFIEAIQLIPPGSPASVKAEFPQRLEEEAELAAFISKLDALDRGRAMMKELLVARFEDLTGQIEAKLRAHAASITTTTSAGSVPPVSASPVSVAPVSPPRPAKTETLFEHLSEGQIEDRRGTIDRVREFLLVLETAAELPESRKVITGSITELSELEEILPVPDVFIEPPRPAATPPLVPPTARVKPSPKVQAEKVADQIVQLRNAIRQSLLTSWKIDPLLAATQNAAHAEQARARAAKVAADEVWLGAAGKIAMTIAVGAFAAFLVLVFADLLQTFFDTATNTGRLAEGSGRGVTADVQR